jgi:ABC-2 type transport system permease protein
MNETMTTTRPLYWSVRRELWENRSIYVVPLLVAGFVLFGFLVSIGHVIKTLRGVEALEAVKQRHAVAIPYSMGASMILFAGFVVAMFYCLDALYGERRDRSILFWKSLPVSDRTTVLSKLLIPGMVLPLVTFIIALMTQAVMLVLSTMALMGSGINPVVLWSRLPLFEMTFVMMYGLTAYVLWFAPIYGWLLLISAWAKRAAFLWAIVPVFALYVVTQFGFGSRWFLLFLRYRFAGPMTEAFTVDAGKSPVSKLSQLDPLKFLMCPGLWLGLLFAAMCLAAAVKLRRNREPI